MISVVIPAYNEEDYLPKCLKSLREQDFTGDYEIIVVDNASTDHTSQIAHQFGAKVVSCPRRGVAYARQAGAEAASGDIIVQADADTVYPLGWLSRISAHFASRPDSVSLAGTYIYENPPRWAKLEYILRYFINRFIGVPLIGQPVCVSGANFAFRRQAFLKTEGYDPHTLYPDQWGISRQLSKGGKTYYDRNLTGVTSTRRVLLPTHMIIITLAMNIFRVIKYFLGLGAANLKRFTRKIPFVRTPARLGISIFLLGGIIILTFGYALPTSQVFGKVYYKSMTPSKVIALTFDDGPNEPYTSQVLDILKSNNVKATFFVIGKNVELYPEVARRMLAEGHVIGNHTYSHNPNHAYADRQGKDIGLAQAVIFSILGVTPHLYRPPHGKKSPWESQTLKRDNLVGVTWSDATNEEHSQLVFGDPVPEVVARKIINSAKPGRIILMHDGFGLNHNDAKSDKSLTVKALPIIIEELKKQGYEFVTVPELLKIPAYNLEYTYDLE